MRRRFRLPLLAATSLLLAGCGPSIPDGAVDGEWQAAPEGHPDYDPIAPVGPGGDLELEMGDFFFEEIGGTPVTGEIDVTSHNVSGQFHDVHFAGAAEGSEVIEAEGGEAGTGTVLLFPGEWTYWCDVPGHREAGMEGTVTVYATEDDAAEAAEEGELPGDEDGNGAADGDQAGGDEADPVEPGA